MKLKPQRLFILRFNFQDQDTLSAADLEQLQELILLTPADVLETLEENALPDFFALINVSRAVTLRVLFECSD